MRRGRPRADDPKSAGPHRLLAQIYERQRKPDAAVDEWHRVLTLAARREAPTTPPFGARPTRAP